MHPFRELSRRPRRALLLGLSLSRRRRKSAGPRQRSARQLAAVAAPALAAGVALEFFFDPRSGRRRRNRVRDRTKAALGRRRRVIQRQARYEAGKVAGLAHAITHHDHGAPELDDVGLARKVESELFRDRTVLKGQISINADRSRLRGRWRSAAIRTGANATRSGAAHLEDRVPMSKSIKKKINKPGPNPATS